VKEFNTNKQNNFPRRLVTDDWLDSFHKTGTGELKTLTNSMRPLIQAGDSLCIKKIVGTSKIKIGDIIAFWRGNMVITHRVVRKIKRDKAVWFLERGDCTSQTALVHSESVMGVVTKIKKKGNVLDLETIKMKLYNRALGFVFLSEWIMRLYGRRITGPLSFIRSVTKAFYVFLKSLLHRLMTKSIKTK
jgi:signal peptidase I